MRKDLKKGQIYLIDFSRNDRTSVISGLRPGVIVSDPKTNPSKNTISVIPMTSKNRPNSPAHIKVKGFGLKKESIMLIEHLQTIDKRKIKRSRYIGEINKKMQNRMHQGLRLYFGIDNVV